MTEHDWLTDPNPPRLAAFAAGQLDPRRTRLLATALCRTVGGLVTDAVLVAAIEAAERFADGGASRDELERARQAAREAAVKAYAAYTAVVERGGESAAELEAGQERAWAASFAAATPVPLPEVCARVDHAGADRALLNELIRDVGGNPFRPVAFEASWRTGTAVALARQMYAAAEFSAMPILADALQDAGCHDERVMGHCKEGRHARGCWVIDGVLGHA